MEETVKSPKLATVKDKGEEDDVKETTSTDMVDRANAAAQRMEEANEKKEELLEREEKLAVSRALGGSSEAGQEPVEPKEETPAEYAKKVMGGDDGKTT